MTIGITLVFLFAFAAQVAAQQPAEIRIAEDGRPRPVAVFRFDGAVGGDPPLPLPAGAYTNRVEYFSGAPRWRSTAHRAGARRRTALALDGAPLRCRTADW
jgi:hypothetical protein